MHSRKSIFKKGIVFVMSMLAFTFFVSIKVQATCEVTLKDGNQYLTVGGNQSSWNDGLLSLETGCSNLVINSIDINGVNQGSSVKSFVLENREPGHYSVKYNYSYTGRDGTTNRTGSIYRYVRVLDNNLSTSNNYTLGSFEFEGTTSVIDSFVIDGTYFANFVVSGNNTYVVVKDSVGRTIATQDIKYGTASLVAKKVLRSGATYYVVGNTGDGVDQKGVMVSYFVQINSGAATISPGTTFDSDTLGEGRVIYNGAYLDGANLYFVGQDSRGYPRIDTKLTNDSDVYTYDVKGAYNSVVVVNGTIYAVGYTKADSATNATGLYTYIQQGEDHSVTILSDSANTIFHDIVYDSESQKNIVVGESNINQIYANNSLAATNNKQGYADGVVLQVALDGTSITSAYMLGGADDDAIYQIKNYEEDKYVLVGTMSNGISGLTYRLTASSFEVEEDVVSGSSKYISNGVVSWNNGYAYYGLIKSDSVLGVYYPNTITGDHDALLLVLDNRKFTNHETINLVKGKTYKYCDYALALNGGDYYSDKCDPEGDGILNTDLTFNTTVSGTSTILTYEIENADGVKILVYRVARVNEAPTPGDLNVNSLPGYDGILRWHVYNRPYSYVNGTGTRYETTNFKYKFSNTNVHQDEDIFDMIDSYFENGNTATYTLVYDNTASNEFINSKQTNAAFATIEMAKKFAYYQELSRVVKITGQTLDNIGAYRYVGTGSGTQVGSENEFYIYYIDYRGNRATDLVKDCSVSPTSISNCTAKGGYAFANLNDIKRIIESFLEYNNYFVTTRNTIYNGSIPASEIEEYEEDLTTDKYLSSVSFANTNNNDMAFNVQKDGDSVVTPIQIVNKNIYFGGKFENGKYTHPSISKVEFTFLSEEKSTLNGITYYTRDNYVFFPENLCYNVYYSYDLVVGKDVSFCLDTTAPEIVYKKDGADSNSVQKPNSNRGSSPESPLFVEDDFSIVNLIDLDEYAYIYIKGNRYTLACELTSPTCKEEIETYIRQSFKYDKNDPMALKSITFSDRLSNSNTLYFVVGTLAPSITYEENETKTGFTLKIDFYDKNPIRAISTAVSQQACSGVNDGCYNPASSDKSAITNSLMAFNEALENYIYAVGYRDNQNDADATLTIQAEDGVYTIVSVIDGVETSISYILQDNQFIEISGYEESYPIDSNNMFEYKDTNTYSYDILSSKINPMKYDEEFEEFVVDLDKDSISILDGEFKFVEDGKAYKVVEIEGSLYVEAVARKYDVYNEKLLSVNDVIYTVDFDEQLLSYTNPEINSMKRIELEFTRTIESESGLSGGVDIPATKRVTNDKGVELMDPNTNLPAYEIDEEQKPIHFNLVDGVYMFTITQDFKPETKTIETKINVQDLELQIGYAKYHSSMRDEDIQRGKLFDFESGEDDETNNTIAIEKLTSEFVYELDASIVASSNLDSYSNTYFMNKPVYLAYTNVASLNDKDTTTVFTIRVYSNKNEYGLPYKDPYDHDWTSENICQEFIIYSNQSGNNPVTTKGCGPADDASFPMTFASVSANTALLKEYGVHQINQNAGAFAFNGQNKFYEVSLVTYSKDAYGTYSKSAVTVTNHFYIDSLNPLYNDGVHGKTITPYIYDENDVITDRSFEEDGMVYKLEGTVGSTINIGFKVNWYSSTSTDFRENKLLLMSILDGDSTITCNVYQLLNNPSYSSECREYVDIEQSVNDGDDFMIVFSDSGVYEVTFKDASQNGVTYAFSIDKSAPVAKLIDATIDGRNLLYKTDAKITYNEYVVLSYVQNPTFTIKLEDLSSINSFCYYFDYGQARSNLTPKCTPGSGNEYEVSLSEYTIEGVSAKDYLMNNKMDRNVTLYVWGSDELGNESVTPSRIDFWVDYTSPSANFEDVHGNLNTQYINASDIDNNGVRDYTITVLSSTYSGVTKECSASAGFMFEDSRYTAIAPPYEFVITCQDVHDSSLGLTYPVDEGFENTMYMRFYESDGEGKKIDEVSGKPEIFNFSRPAVGGNARWIYITVVDFVGNESENYTIIPIIVQDSEEPSVIVQEKGEGVAFEPVTYKYPGADNATKVYLANEKIKLIFSEPIASIKSCSVVVAKLDNNGDEEITYSGACDNELYGDGYASGIEYQYSDLKTSFTFEKVIDNHYRIIVFEVLDFAGLSSGPIVVVIDRIAPTIDFVEGGDSLDYIEYITSGTTYGHLYQESGYSDDVFAKDDQLARLKVNVEYARYSPSVTYKNYIYFGGRYQTIPDGSPRSSTTKYYLMMKANALENKECLKVEGEYCFVEDNQSSYYFNSLLEDESGDIWKKDISEINSSNVGVYRISYSVTDFAGNTSEKIYNKVFVNDKTAPDIDIYDRNENTKLYSNLTSDNPQGFEGKLNQVVTFKGTDGLAKAANTRIVLYMCGLSAYTNATCDIDQPLYTSATITRSASTSNVFNIGNRLVDGVYKTFVYDFGQYKNLNASSIMYDGSTLVDEEVYSLTHNASSFFFAVRRRSFEIDYVVHGNKYTEQYGVTLGNEHLSFEYSKDNYYTITNSTSSEVRDIYLMVYNSRTQTYEPAYGTNAIGFSGDLGDFIVDHNGWITVPYKDSLGRVVYEIKYQVYDVLKHNGKSNLLLHETYYNIDAANKKVDICAIENGKNPCEDLSVVYQVVSVTARIYLDGTYTFKMFDRYGNGSQDLEELVVDNKPYTENKDNTRPTGINYWFSVPSQVVSADNAHYFANLTNFDKSGINVLDSKYTSNFNSDFFYAFAHETDATEYLTVMYQQAITSCKNNNSTFAVYGIDGVLIRSFNCSDPTVSVESMYQFIVSQQLISKLIFPTYVGNKNFSDSNIKQVAYQGDLVELSSSMYEYVYLRVTTVVAGNGKVSYTYDLAGSSCVPGANQECIKVDLQIVQAENNSIELIKEEGISQPVCKFTGTTDCSLRQVYNDQQGVWMWTINPITSGATYIFIETEEHKYHVNTVYYGITAYTKEADIIVNQVGDFVPLEKFEKYSLDEKGVATLDPVNGGYIWLNSEWVLIDDIMHTNLYSSSCTFDSSNYGGCVYVTYLSRYREDNVEGTLVYTPSEDDRIEIYYYNYHDGAFYKKSEIMELLDIDTTYNSNGTMADGPNGNVVPFTVKQSTLHLSLNSNMPYNTNKKVYVELFNETTTDNVDPNKNTGKIFEVKVIKNQDGTYNKVYTYVTLSIGGIYVNLNSKIIMDADNRGYRCVIDIPVEEIQNMRFVDRAGNEIPIKFSHTSITPTLEYNKSTEATTSDVIISIETASDVASLNESLVVIKRYENGVFVSNVPSSCTLYSDKEQSADGRFIILDLQFRYDSYTNCSGVYRVEVSDNYGNTNYLEFVFNPYNLITSYNLEENGSHLYEYVEDGINGVIVKDSLKVNVDEKLNYVVINKYASYSNLDLKAPLATLEITDFSGNKIVGGSCNVVITKVPDSVSVYTVAINGSSDHGCDGIYTVDIVNRFSKTILETAKFRNLLGANTELITYRVNYNASTTVEIDTIAPDTSVMESDTEQRFTLHVDGGEANIADTKQLLLSPTKTIEYTNKYITVSWGGYDSYSFTYLQHRFAGGENPNPSWTKEKRGIKYNFDYVASYEFRITEPGKYTLEFMFADEVGNEDASQIFTIVITIEAPRVGFYETNHNGSLIGDKYANDQRIADRTILQCSVPAGGSYELRSCTMEDYNYSMTVNGKEYPQFYDDYELRDVISRESPWLRNSEAQYAEELMIVLTVSVKSKPEIYTRLNVVIDKKAPRVEIDGKIVGSTYTSNVTINISQDDATNNAIIYKCDKIDEESRCLVLNSNKQYVEGGVEYARIEKGVSAYIMDETVSGYYYVFAQDDLGNTYVTWFVIDNKAPTISITANDSKLAPHTYTNAASVFVEVNDELSKIGSKFDIQFTPFHEGEELGDYVSSVGLTKEGKYVITPTDAVGKVGRSMTFYIYRQTPKYQVVTDGAENTHLVNTEVSLTWSVSEEELVAPIVSVVINGKLYTANYDSVNKKYIGDVIKDIGEHTFVVRDAAGNTGVTMVTINNTKKVCINGNSVEVKMQAYYNIDELLIGNEPGIEYEVDDVIIFALPSQATGGDCSAEGLLGYRTLDSKNSFYLVQNQRNANSLNNTEAGINFVEYGFISPAAIKEVENVGGTVVVFVVTKDMANNQLGYKVGTNFYMEDPIGWTIIFMLPFVFVWPVCRIFIKKKVKVI